MVYGAQLALSEISLVLFTTLAPSGVVALMLMGMPFLFGKLTGPLAQRVNRFLCIPLVISMVGLIMSATHLGNPENVLYVFMRIGVSPLSNEVAGAVVFLVLAGVYWLYSFARTPCLVLQRVWFGCLCCAGIAFVALIAFAYAADTIVAWDVPFVPLNLALNSLVGGPLLAFAGLRFAGLRAEHVLASTPYVESADEDSPVDIGLERSSFFRFIRILFVCSFLAAVANVVSMALQNAELPKIGNELASVSELVPFYSIAIVAFAVLCAVGILLNAYSVRKGGRVADALVVTGCVCVFAGIFVVRFSFYAMHLTIGLGM